MIITYFANEGIFVFLCALIELTFEINQSLGCVYKFRVQLMLSLNTRTIPAWDEQHLLHTFLEDISLNEKNLCLI